MKTLKRDRFGNRAVKSPTIPGKYNDSFFFLLYSGPLFVSTFSMGKWLYRLDGWKKGKKKENHGSLKIWIRFQKTD